MLDVCSQCSSSLIECEECGTDINDCDCFWESDFLMRLHCHNCDQSFHVPTDKLRIMFCDAHLEALTIEGEVQQDSDEEWLGLLAQSPCRHTQTPIIFPEGTVVHASSYLGGDDGEEPDFGLYLDRVWHSPGFAYYIDWQDYGLPIEDHFETAAMVIVEVYNRATGGMFVEVGCTGGHGRTGTVLACMATLNGLEPETAIDWVREHYCDRAVETDEQEWFVHYFHLSITAGTTEPNPKTQCRYTFDKPWTNWASYRY